MPELTALSTTGSLGWVPCGEVSFAKTNHGAEEDCLTSEVCLTRADQGPIYNSVRDAAPTSGVSCNSSIPTGTLWAMGSCSSATKNQFGAFLSAKFADCYPPSVVGSPGCLKIGESFWDIAFQSWTSSAQGGGFSYTRSVNVAPGVACE